MGSAQSNLPLVPGKPNCHTAKRSNVTGKLVKGSFSAGPKTMVSFVWWCVCDGVCVWDGSGGLGGRVC